MSGSAVLTLPPLTQVVSEEFLEAVEERIADARAGKVVSMLVLSLYHEDHALVCDQSIVSQRTPELIGMIEVLKGQLQYGVNRAIDDSKSEL